MTAERLEFAILSMPGVDRLRTLGVHSATLLGFGVRPLGAFDLLAPQIVDDASQAARIQFAEVLAKDPLLHGEEVGPLVRSFAEHMVTWRHERRGTRRSRGAGDGTASAPPGG